MCCVDCAIKHHFDLEEYESKSQAHIEEDKMRSGRLYYLQTGQVKPLWLGEQQFLINRLKVLQKERDNERAGVLIRERSVSSVSERSSDGNPDAKMTAMLELKTCNMCLIIKNTNCFDPKGFGCRKDLSGFEDSCRMCCREHYIGPYCEGYSSQFERSKHVQTCELCNKGLPPKLPQIPESKSEDESEEEDLKKLRAVEEHMKNYVKSLAY